MDIGQLIWLQLMSLFPQPVRRQPSVGFLPGRRRAESAERGRAAK